MGNFYANIALRTDDIEAVADALATLRRDAWIATDAGVTVVFDRKCDEQDIAALEGLSVELARRLRCAAIGVCNHDDDALLLLSIDEGNIVDRYESTPGYFTGARRAPAGGNAEWLSARFGSPNRVNVIADALRAPHSAFVVEIDRHRLLQESLGLPASLSFLGYHYVTRGELTGPGAETLRHVGNNPGGDARVTRGPATPKAAYEYPLTALAHKEKNLLWDAYALALAEADVPDRFAPILGVGKWNGQILFRRLRDYVVSNKLVGVDGQVRADDVLAQLLGEAEFHFLALTRLLREALRIPPLSGEQIATLGRGDPALLRRIASGFEAVERDANPAAFAESEDESE